jgi:hypothetical protein
MYTLDGAMRQARHGGSRCFQCNFPSAIYLLLLGVCSFKLRVS